MIKCTRICLFLIALLFTRAGHGQLLKIGFEGFQRRTQFDNSTSLKGPLNINAQDNRYSYGLTLSYEQGNNGVEIGLLNFPYRVDLRFNNFFNVQSGPSNITLLSTLYKRKLINFRRYRLAVYGMGGLSWGKYTNSNLTEGTGTVMVNGSIIYTGHLNRYSTYNYPFVLLPTLKLEIDKSIFSHFVVGVHASYLLNNLIGHATPLEQGTYTYSYYQQNGSGKLADYGTSLFVGIALKYYFDLNKRRDNTKIQEF